MHFTSKKSTKPFPGLRPKTISVLFLILSFGLQKTFAQITEDFSDGEFSSNPLWSGSADNFVVNDAFQLQLNAAVAGTSWLSTPFPPAEAGEVSWEFFLKQTFAPSAGNFGRLYLASDQQDLTLPLDGYYLQFGEAGANDAVELFRQAGSNRVSVCRATPAGIAASFALRVKVTRDGQGLWEVFIDYAGGGDFVREASGSDPTQTEFLYSGVLCTYTITNATRFYFDDILIQSARTPDVTPPQIGSVEVTSGESLDVIFSEEVSSLTAENPLNYFVSPSPGNPSSARLKEDHKTVELYFPKPFVNGVLASLKVKDVADILGNVMDDTEKAFLFFEESPVNYRDLVITEFCADPSPALGLPEAEFVEIYNRSEHPVDLAGWTLEDEITSGQAASLILLPGQYLILAAPSNVAKFSAAGQTLSVSPFPSLNNSGDVIKLKNNQGKTIDSVRYEVSWYRDSEKADGGWSLELIDFQNICAERSNWADAEAPSGGTPGQQNSIYANRPDNTGPRLISLALLTPSSLLIQFDEKLEAFLPAGDKFKLDPPVVVQSVDFGDESFSSIVLRFSGPLESSVVYSIQVGDVYDCPGNKIEEAFSRGEFVLPAKATPGDIVINEVLSNPRSTGVDFVELYNRSENTIDLKNWTVRNFHVPRKNFSLITDRNLLIHAGEYKVLTENGNTLKGEYLAGHEDSFFQTDLPPLDDDEGTLTLIDETGHPIDSMAYHEGMHVRFLKDREGVSLERISLEEIGTVTSNWRSASSTFGFATPGFVNSNVRTDMWSGREAITVEPEIFQPNAPGRTFALINYRFERGGFMANVRILDQHGRSIREIAENQLLGAEGFFRWDGDHDNGTAARVGYYLVWFEIFDDRGNVKTYRERVALY